MKKTVLRLSVVCLILLGVVACSSSPSSNHSIPAIDTTTQFRIDQVSLTVSQLVTPDIVYHTENEVESIVADSIKASLAQEGLLTTDSSMDALDIAITYKRRFVGDETPIPSDSLAYPTFGYVISIKRAEGSLATVSKQDLTYRGGFAMNLKVAGGLLRDKSDETAFFNALSDSISDTVKALSK